MTAPLLRVIAKANVPAMIVTSALGEKHAVKYRMFAGMLIMSVGVGVAKLPALLDWHFAVVHFALDLVGYAVHGIGLTPFLEALIKVSAEVEEVE